MLVNIKMVPENAGQFVSDGDYYHPDHDYKPGDSVVIKVLPNTPYQFTGWEGDVPDEFKSSMPLRLTLREGNQSIVATFKKGPKHSSELLFDSNFENGNGI